MYSLSFFPSSLHTNARTAATSETSTVGQPLASPPASPSNQITPPMRLRRPLGAELPPKDSAGGPLRPTSLAPSINSDEDNPSTPDCIHYNENDDEWLPVSYKYDNEPFPVSVCMCTEYLRTLG